MLYIVDGDSVAGTLSESSIPGEVLIYGDLLYEGPTPAGLSSDAWEEIRARFYSDAGYASMEDASPTTPGLPATTIRSTSLFPPVMVKAIDVVPSSMFRTLKTLSSS